MKLKQFLRLAGIVTLVLGLAIMLLPVPVLTFFANGKIPNDIHFVRFLGTALVGFGVLNWTASNLSDTKAVLPILYGNFVSLTLGVVIDLVGLVAGNLNMRSAWILLLHSVFGAGFGYYIVQLRHTNSK